MVIAEEPGFRRELLCRNRYFVTERIELVAGAVFGGVCNGDSLEIWGVIQGEGAIEDVALSAVRFCLLPAAMGEYTVTATTAATLLRTYVAQPSEWNSPADSTKAPQGLVETFRSA